MVYLLVYALFPGCSYKEVDAQFDATTESGKQKGTTPMPHNEKGALKTIGYTFIMHAYRKHATKLCSIPFAIFSFSFPK